jgi:mono/diheme cytochrome c family protein
LSIGELCSSQSDAITHQPGSAIPVLATTGIIDPIAVAHIEAAQTTVPRNGTVYMPKFEGILSQEGIWAIRSWLDTKFTE